MRQVISHILLGLFLVNTFGYGVLNSIHRVQHMLNIQSHQNSIFHYHVHTDGESDHTHTVADHFSSSSNQNPTPSQLFLLIDFLNHPQVTSPIGSLDQIEPWMPLPPSILESRFMDDGHPLMVAPPPEQVVI